MKAWWEKQSARIDSLSLRERVFLFLSLLVCLVAIADVLWLTPAQTAQRQIVQRFSAQTTELARLRQDLQTTAKPSDESIALRNELASLQSRIDAVNHDIQASAPAGAGGPALEQVLVQFLRRQEGLTLMSTSTLKSAVPASSAPPAAVSTADAGVPAGLNRRGLELRVAGPYGELVRYVKTLETALPNLHWGPMQLKADKATPELTLQVYLVGVQP